MWDFVRFCYGGRVGVEVDLEVISRGRVWVREGGLSGWRSEKMVFRWEVFEEREDGARELGAVYV